jgi:hypothetical protein
VRGGAIDLDNVDILVLADTEEDVLLEELSNGLFDPKLADKVEVSAAGNLERLRLFPSQVFVNFCFDGVAEVFEEVTWLPSSFSLVSLSLIAATFEEVLESFPTSFNFLFGLPSSH